MFEPAVVAQALVQRVLARMTEGRMPEVMRQRDGLGQVFVESQRAGDRTCNLGHLDRMSQTCTKEVSLMIDEDLGFVLETAERRAMDDAVAVALVLGAVRGRGFRIPTSARGGVMRGVGCQHYAASRMLARVASSWARG